MMTKLAHMRENRKNNKGFSLVELIIVIAIMVALIAVMGPQYVKYIQKSRNSALASAAEDLEAWCKTAVADEDTQLSGTGYITIAVTDGKLNVQPSGLTMLVNGTSTTVTTTNLATAAGYTENAKMGNTAYAYKITFASSANGTTVTMVQTAS